MSEVTGADQAAVERFAEQPQSAQDEYLLNLPAVERRAFIEKVERVSADDDGFLGRLLAPVTSRWRAAERSSELSDRAIAESSSTDTEYVRGVNTSTYLYEGFSREDLQRFVTEENEPGQVGEVSAGYDGLKNGFEELHEALSAALKITRSAWEGEDADAAGDYVSSLKSYSEANTNHARLAAEVVARQSESASTAKSSMPEPIPFSWSEELKRITSNPITAPWAVSDAFDKQQRSQDAKDQAVEVMNGFDGNSYSSASKQPVFAEPPKFAGSGGGDSGDNGSAGIGGRSTGTPNVGPGGGGTSSSGFSPGGGAGGYTPPAGSGGYSPPGGSSTSPSLQPGGQVGAGAPGGTAPSFAPGSFNPSRPGAGSSGSGAAAGLGGMPFGPMGGMAGGAGDATRGGGGSGQRGGGFGPTGSGASGAGQNLAGGRLAGAGPGGMGGATAAGAAGAKPGGMGAGGRGAGGMMGGAGASKGQGGEDKEHKDSYYMKQEFEVGLTETDEHGEKMIDPETGLPVVPPVIGG